MGRQIKISADGFMDLSDRRRVRTPGSHDTGVEPMLEAEALSFLLSHSFPGHRRLVRPISATDRKNIRLAVLVRLCSSADVVRGPRVEEHH